MLVSRAPRVLTLDIVGEARGTYADGIGPFFGLSDTLRAVQLCATRAVRWHVIAALDDDEIPQLFRRLVPPYDGRSVSLSEAVGGLSIECGEVDMVAPNGSAPREVVNAYRRGRHVGLSLLCGTQRPASCARDCTAQADIVATFGTVEPNDVEFWRRTLGGPVSDVVRQLPTYHSVVYQRATGRVLVLDPARVPYRTLAMDGTDVA